MRLSSAKNAARANDLTGWVDNLWDGRVEMEVQGELSGIERMIQEIEMGSFIRIEPSDCILQTASGKSS